MKNENPNGTAKNVPDELQQQLNTLQDDMNELLAIMDFYQEVVDITQLADDPADMESNRRKYGMFLVAGWMLKRGEALLDGVDQVKNHYSKSTL